MMSPEKRKLELAFQKEDYENQLKMEQNSTNWEFLISMLFTPQKYSPFFSFSNFLDFICFYVTFALGIFTLSLICQTSYYVYRQSSLIDQTKRYRYNR